VGHPHHRRIAATDAERLRKTDCSTSIFMRIASLILIKPVKANGAQDASSV
jgi:hypothetical protein